MAVDCLPCALSNHESCWRPDGTMCCCPASYWDRGDNPLLVVPDGITDGRSEKREQGGQIKDAEAVTDTESTGRKRAAKLFPIEKGVTLCEWAGLKLAGGGVLPIIGCIPEARAYATDIHHGPNKSTLANFVGNVHRICSTCHNRWHSVNDKYYEPVRPVGMDYWPLPDYEVFEHLPFVYATDIERVGYETAWIEKNVDTFLHTLIESEKDKLKALTR